MPPAEINFVNKSLAVSPVDVVLFEPAEFFDKLTTQVPWLFIKHCSYDFSHPFLYAASMEIQLRDDWGNYSPPIKAEPGMRYVIRNVNKKEKLESAGPGKSGEVEIFNNLPEGAPAIVINRNGRISAIRTGLAPGEYFLFRIPDQLLGRKISGDVQAAQLQRLENDGFCSLINMKDITKADLVLTGGGIGATTKKYSLTLQHIIGRP
jgi:hypothetical protein